LSSARASSRRFHLGLKLPGAAGAALGSKSDVAQVLRMAENAGLSLQGNGVGMTAHNGSPSAAEEAMAARTDGFEHGYHLQPRQLAEMKARPV